MFTHIDALPYPCSYTVETFFGFCIVLNHFGFEGEHIAFLSGY